MSSSSYINSFLTQSSEISEKLKSYEPEIEKVIDALFSAWKNNKPVFVVGNGGSAGTATHFVADLVKTVIDSPTQKGVRAMALADNIPLISAATNDCIETDLANNFCDSLEK